MSFWLSVWSLFSFLQEITDLDLILTWGILLISNTFLSIFRWKFSMFFCAGLCVCQCLSGELSRCFLRSVSRCLCRICLQGLFDVFSIFSFNICLVVLRRSVWAGSQFLRCLSNEDLANVLSGLSSVSANISLVSLVAVFPKCLSMSAAKSVYRSCLASFRVNPRFFFQYLF